MKMNKKGQNYSIPAILVILFLVGFGILFLFWYNHQEESQKYVKLQQDYAILNQSYNELQYKYNTLYQQYNSLQLEYSQFKQDTKSLLLGYVAKETLWEISGLEKYRRIIEILGIIVTGRSM
jgi:hypothetical protein